MIIATGTMKAASGAEFSVAALAADYAKGPHRVLTEEKYWTYDVVGNDFVAIPLDKIFAQDTTSRIFEVKTKTGRVLLPEGGKLLKDQLGFETTVSVAGMCMFRSWSNGMVIRARFGPDGPEKYVEEIESVVDLGDPIAQAQQNAPPTQYGIYEVAGAMGIARLLVVDGFLVG